MITNRTLAIGCSCLLAIAGSACTTGDEQAAASYDQHRTWHQYGGGPDQSKFVELSGIDRTNVDQLEVAWFYPTSDNTVYHFNPIVVDGVMYLLANDQSLTALDAETGEEIWLHTNLRGITRRGINYWESSDGEDKRLIFQMNNYLQAIDARTGQSITDFGTDGVVDLRQGLDRDPDSILRAQSGFPGQLFEDLIILGSSTGENYMATPGHLRAFNVMTGEPVWTFRTIPHPGEYGYDTWPEEAYKYVGGANTWGEITIDTERGIAFFPTASPKYNYWGGDRLGANLFGNSLIALDARTGERLWHFQTIHHDLFDYDVNAAPQLLTINRDGREIDVVAVATKQGFLFVFDRETGEPVFDIEERPVPQYTDVPGEEVWPTQPHPVELPPFSKSTLTSDDVSPYLMTDEEREEWKERIDRLNELDRVGVFVPHTLEYPTLSMPGAVGGANWGSTASNPGTGMMYIRDLNRPSFYEPLQEIHAPAEEDEADLTANLNAVARGDIIYEQQCQACHGADREGLGAGPSLRGLENRFSIDDFSHLVTQGIGEMPAFGFLEDDELMNLFTYLGGSPSGEIVEPPIGPVVASGGALGSRQGRSSSGARSPFGIPYPDDMDVSDVRYYSPTYGLGQNYVVAPPWTSIVAYDLNEGVIRWRAPLGEDRHAVEEGAENTGMLAGQRNGMIVTSTGLLFSTARDGKLYAFDTENGDELWSVELPGGTEGLPSMYEVNGRHYIAVIATSPIRWGRGEAVDPDERGYVVFALPGE